MAGRVQGKATIVTGAGQSPGSTIGNGRAIAMMLAREGARVICADRVLASAEETVDAIRAEGGEAHPVHLDITNAASVTAGVEHALQLLGRIDVVVNNVGIGGRGDGPAHRVDEAAFDRILQVNLTGMMHVTKAVLPVMREQRSGSIVNISSLAARPGRPDRVRGVEGRGQPPHHERRPVPGAPRHPLQRSPARPARHADGRRRHRTDARPLRGRGPRRTPPTGAARRPHGERRGTRRTPCCTWRPTRPRFVSGAILPVDGAMGVAQATGT
ncbi:MAG: SDR family NAD(P)-dependent oxidoreductase [Ilumatobacteraceae bacterium]